MFASVGRRLALLNALVVVAVIASVGGVTYGVLQHTLNSQLDHALHERAKAAAASWQADLAAGRLHYESPPVANDSQHDGDDTEDGAEASRELLEGGDTFLFAFDRSGTVVANERAIQLNGLPSEAGVKEALAGNDDTRTVKLASGELVRVRTEPVKAEGKIVGAVQAARDLAQTTAEGRLVTLVSLAGVGLGGLLAVPAGLFLARRAMRPIDAAFQRQRAFVADASHELRTPLAVIRANAELVQRLPEATAEEVRTEMAGILSEVDTMRGMVDDLLLLARSDAGRLELHRAPVDLAELVRGAVAPMAALAGAAGLRLTVEAPAPVTADVDAERIRQAVRILVDNAISFTPAGGSVTVSVERKERDALIRVRDTGVGIAPAEQAHVWNRFYRTDQARSRSTGGTGLGLSIARAIVTAHHGEIGLSSRPSQGTTVWLTLPTIDRVTAG